MKKLLFVLASTLLLAGCSGTGGTTGSGESAPEVKGKTTVNLTMSNYTDFIAPRVSTMATGGTTSDNIYVDAYFEGSDLVLFNNCSVTCHYQLSGTERLSDTYTVKLTISGDGYVPSYVFKDRPEFAAILVVTGVTGSVTYLY